MKLEKVSFLNLFEIYIEEKIKKWNNNNLINNF